MAGLGGGCDACLLFAMVEHAHVSIALDGELLEVGATGLLT